MSNESIRIERQNARIQKVRRERMLLLGILAAVVLIGAGITFFKVRKPRITLEVKSVSITQDEEIPKFKVDVVAKGNQKKVLD